MLRPQASLKEALTTLAKHEVAFIVVGGVAAVLAGAPISTFDLDIVHERTPANVHRLLAALAEMDARYRDPAGRVIIPNAEALRGVGHHLLITKFGPLDVLGKIGTGRGAIGRGYDELLAETVGRRIGPSTVHVLGLRALIWSKTEAGRDKDRAVLAILQRTLDESERS